MSCTKMKEKFPLYILDELPEEDKKIIGEHLETCSECRQEFAKVKALIESVNTAEDAGIPENYYSHLITSIHDRVNKSGIRKKGFMIPAISGLVTILLAVSLVFIFSGNQEKDFPALAEMQDYEYIISYLDEASLPAVVSDSDFSDFRQSAMLYLLTSADFFSDAGEWVDDVNEEDFQVLIASLENIK